MLFSNISIIDENYSVKKNIFVGVKGNIIDYISSEKPSEDFGEVYNGNGKLLIPSFYNAHSHLPMHILRGYGENLSLMNWLNKKIFPFEAKLTEDDIYYSCLAGVAEMLLQSHGGVIKILPAIPKDWRNGEFSGLVARGNFVVSAVWKDGRIKEGTIESRLGEKCRLYLDGKVAIIEDENKNEVPVKFENGVSEFMTENGKTYSFC